jgi:hypothetical protein
MNPAQGRVAGGQAPFTGRCSVDRTFHVRSGLGQNPVNSANPAESGPWTNPVNPVNLVQKKNTVQNPANLALRKDHWNNPVNLVERSCQKITTQGGKNDSR